MTRSARLLVVDDDPAVGLIVEGALSKHAVRVERVSTGEDALERLERSPPDAVLLDIRLPGMDGLQVYRALRERQFDRPVVLMSSFPDARARADAELDREPPDVLSKPINLSTIQRIVQEMLSAAHGG